MAQEKRERIFISYKRVDKERVFAIKDGIEQATGEKCWIDLDGIESDAQFADVIISAINRCEVFLFMYSASHTKIVNRKKDWTIREISFAEKKDKRIVFVNIDNSPLTDWFELNFGTTQQVDATDTEKLAHLHKDLCLWLKIDTTKLNQNQISDGGQLEDDSSVAVKERNTIPCKIKKIFWQNKKNKVCFLLIVFALVASSAISVIKCFPLTVNQIHDSYDSALVMLHSEYHFEVECGELDVSLLPDPDDYNNCLLSKFVVEWTDSGLMSLSAYDGSNSMTTLGSGTFIGEEGNIVTNLHMARPWLQEISTAGETKSLISLLEDYYLEKLHLLMQDGATSLDHFLPKFKIKGVIDGCYATFNGNYIDLSNSYACKEVVASDELDYGLAIMRMSNTYIPTEYIPLKNILDRVKIKYGTTIFVGALPDHEYRDLTSPYQKYFVEGKNLKSINGKKDSFFEVSVPMMFDITEGGPVLDSHGRMIGVVSAVYHNNDDSAVFKITQSGEILQLINQAKISK